MPQSQAQAQCEPSQVRAAESLTQEIDLMRSLSRDGMEGVGNSEMIMDVDRNVMH